jgi:hypothetical protein
MLSALYKIVKPIRKGRFKIWGNIYKNATVTIAASVAKGVSDGFLRVVRIPPESCEFRFQVPDKGESTIFVSRWGLFVPSHPLDSRGWALQEWLLSHRLLVYSEKELIWHCQKDKYKTVTRSCFDYLPMMERLPPKVFNDNFRGGKSWTTQKQRVELWKSLVQNYSSRSLTNREDRLNALVGVANELEHIWNDNLIFGLWKQCFIELMAWHIDGHHSASESRSAREPSWSWASLECRVNFKIMAHTDAYVSSFSKEDPMQVSLNCRVLDASSFQMSEIWALWDLLSDEQLLKHVRLLVLGNMKARGTNRIVGIMAVLEDSPNGRFRRVGLFNQWPSNDSNRLWEAAHRRVITLV